MERLLLTTPVGPFAEQYFNTSPTDVMNQRFSRGCDIFTLHGHLHVNFAHLIAQNVSVPSVFLEYPRMEDFVAELRKGYAWLGINSFHNQNDVVIEMCKVARELAPATRIVLGGFGAVGILNCVPEAERRRLCDAICHGEGIRFMRGLLGEPEDAPIQVTHLPRWSYSLPWIDAHPAGNVPIVVASVGCPNACDFCGTTEMFAHRTIRLLTPEQVHAELRRAWTENPYTPQATIIEEDTVRDREFLSELGRLLREDEEFGLSHYNFYCLASLESLSEWDLDELMLTGITNVFVGVESKFAPDQGYRKTRGRAAHELFPELHKRGISTTGAWMAGFDFQTPQNILEDLEYFISLAPSTQQLTRVCPFPGTPMWQRMKKAGRIRDDVRWEEVSFFGGGGVPPAHLGESELMEIIDRGYRKLYERWGPSLVRIVDTHLAGYEHCMTVNRNRFYRDRAELHRKFAAMTYPLLAACEVYAPNQIVRKRVKDMRRRYVRLHGEPTSTQRAFEKALLALAAVQRIRNVVYPMDNLVKEEPFKRYEYPKPAPADGRPYRVTYPHRNGSFERYARFHGVTYGAARLGARVLDTADRLRGRSVDAASGRGSPVNFSAARS